MAREDLLVLIRGNFSSYLLPLPFSFIYLFIDRDQLFGHIIVDWKRKLLDNQWQGSLGNNYRNDLKMDPEYEDIYVSCGCLVKLFCRGIF